MLSRKIQKSNRARNAKQIQMIKNLYSETKDLSAQKSEAWGNLQRAVQKELEKVNMQVRKRENYLSRNKIRPVKALEYLNSDNMSKDSLQASSFDGVGKNKDLRLKPVMDAQSWGESLMTTSESDPKSAMSFAKSPSRLDSLSIFESSPVLKRVKVSEEEEKEIPKDNFNLGESRPMSSQGGNALRKSKRRRKKSKILREATGEDDDIPPKILRKPKMSRADCEISKIIELDELSK